MPDRQIYYQWQNEFLLQTIYPLRETKLRDFLFFFREIEIWEHYKTLTPAGSAAEIDQYCAALRQKVTDSFADYAWLEAYFLDDQVEARYKASYPDSDMPLLGKITRLHGAFKQYFPRYTKPHHKKYFLSARVQAGEQLRKDVLDQIAAKQRAIRNNGPKWASKPIYERDVQKLSTVSIRMAEEELGKLYAFLAAFERLERYQADLAKRRADMEKEKQAAARELTPIRTQIDDLEARLGSLRPLIARMRRAPDRAATQAYFLTADVGPEYRREFPNPDPAILAEIQALHKTFLAYFPAYKNPEREKTFTGRLVKDWQDLRAEKQRELARKRSAAGPAPTDPAVERLRKVTLPMVERELNRLEDLLWAYEHPGQAAQEFSSQASQKEVQRLELESQLQGRLRDESARLARIQALAQAIQLPDREQVLAALGPETVTVKDVARWRAEQYRQELSTKDARQLLELVVAEMVSRPTRYPLWLQYMVIHFSGMRYQSAHGSWADPKDLLASLRTLEVQKEMRAIDEDAAGALCEQKYLCYQAARAGGQVLDEGAEPADVPALARATEPEWVEKVDRHIKAIAPGSGYYKRTALMNLRTDEEEYAVAKYADDQAQEALRDMKPDLPGWLWQEIVRVTGLRKDEVSAENWEMVSADEQAARYARGMGLYRDILVEWKSKHLTGWRQEHDRTDRLIVSRAVCNEVAEHIQHLRGITPPGGLTAKPEWYLHKEKEARQNGPNPPPTGADRPFFRKMRGAANLAPGASLFWTRWMNKKPNMWQITLPFTLLDGEDIILPRPSSDGTHTVTSDGSAYRRTVIQRSQNQSGRTQETTSNQWLRWMHEATIITLAETADGPTVLTFETALPIDDKRQATIGVVKHSLGALIYTVSPSLMIGTFTGYIPQGQVPYDHLREMLDWNHILQRDAYPQAEIDRYWLAVTPPESFALGEEAWVEECWMEVAPALAEGRWQSTRCYDTSADGAGVAVYEPQVPLVRGMRLAVDLARPLDRDGQVYYPVTQCGAQPRAQGLLVRAGELVEAGRRRSTRPVQTLGPVELYRIAGLDGHGRPLFAPAGAHLDAGALLRLSTVDPVGARKRRPYRLISVCPRLPEVEGLFVRTADVAPLKEKDYRRASRITKATPPQP